MWPSLDKFLIDLKWCFGEKITLYKVPQTFPSSHSSLIPEILIFNLLIFDLSLHLTPGNFELMQDLLV